MQARCWGCRGCTARGRQAYAIGGSVENARRIGIRAGDVPFMVYVYVGMLAGLAGMIHASMARVALIAVAVMALARSLAVGMLAVLSMQFLSSGLDMVGVSNFARGDLGQSPDLLDDREHLPPAPDLKGEAGE
jgi:ribose/xylose/arabinose/galactoside ABC-type transport system permease subunit